NTVRSTLGNYNRRGAPGAHWRTSHYLSSASLGVVPSGREWIQKPDQRSRQRAEHQREAEANREQQCSFWRNAVTGKERNHGELPQTPASDRDRDERHADHDREQDRRVWERQREALCPSDRPNDANGGGVNETSNGQDYGPLRSEENAMDVCGQCCEPPGVSPLSERRNDLWCEQGTKHASQAQPPLPPHYPLPTFPQPRHTPTP